MYIASCQSHCHTLYTAEWTQIIVEGQTTRDAFYYWLTKNNTVSTEVVDCLNYPCNPTCTVTLSTEPPSTESPSTESPSGAGSNLRLVRQIHIGQAVGIIGFWLLIILY